MKNNVKRPKFLNLLQIHLPVTGIASINHRLSGVILFLSIPASLYLFQLSLSGESGFNEAIHYFSLAWVKILLVPLAWSFSHHLFAGIRFLLIDQNLGISLAAARKSAWLVIVLALVMTIIITSVWLL